MLKMPPVPCKAITKKKLCKHVHCIYITVPAGQHDNISHSSAEDGLVDANSYHEYGMYVYTCVCARVCMLRRAHCIIIHTHTSRTSTLYMYNRHNKGSMQSRDSDSRTQDSLGSPPNKEVILAAIYM